MIGGQIWGDENTSCSITNLRRVDGTSYVGGFAGKVDPGSVAAIDTATKQGLLNKLLDVLMVNAPAETDQGSECYCFYHPLCICVSLG